MKTEPENNRDDALLDAVLGEAPWTDINAAAKSAALAEFRALQRRRRRQFWAGQVAAGILLAVGAVWWWQQPAAQDRFASTTPLPQHSQKVSAPSANPPSPMDVTAPAVPAQIAQVVAPTPSAIAPHPTDSAPNYISEEQMLALFPKGSCIIAEVDGQTQLIFFDHKIEEEGAPYHPGS